MCQVPGLAYPHSTFPPARASKALKFVPILSDTGPGGTGLSSPAHMSEAREFEARPSLALMANPFIIHNLIRTSACPILLLREQCVLTFQKLGYSSSTKSKTLVKFFLE